MRGPPARAGAQAAATPAPAVGSQSGLRGDWRPPEEGSGGRGPGDATPRAPPPSNRLPAGRGPTGLAWVVVGADRLRRRPPRPGSDRVTWKHETRLRPPVVELSAGPKPFWPAGVRWPGSLGCGRRVRMRGPRERFRAGPRPTGQVGGAEDCSNPSCKVRLLSANWEGRTWSQQV